MKIIFLLLGSLMFNLTDGFSQNITDYLDSVEGNFETRQRTVALACDLELTQKWEAIF